MNRHVYQDGPIAKTGQGGSGPVSCLGPKEPICDIALYSSYLEGHMSYVAQALVSISTGTILTLRYLIEYSK